MRIAYALAGAPALVIFSAAVVVAMGVRPSQPAFPVLKSGIDLGRARVALMMTAPIGTPADVAFARLAAEGLSCGVSRPPLANLTWTVIQCSTVLTLGGTTLSVDVVARNGVVADIGVEEPLCALRADVIDPMPEPGGCDISGKRFLDLEARERAAGRDLLAEVLATPGSDPAPRRR